LCLDETMKEHCGPMSPYEMGSRGGVFSDRISSPSRVDQAKERLTSGYYDRREVLLALAEILIATQALWGED